MIQIKPLLDYFSGVKKEFKHIKFLSKKEVYQIFVLVIIGITVFAIAFSLIDLIISTLVKFIVGW